MRQSDENGRPFSVTYGGNTYYYVLDQQGDVVGLKDINGSTVVKYAYDAWGNALSITDGSGNPVTSGIGINNPLRYRGYYYDTETNLYYLQSRYYSPELRRFLCGDIGVEILQMTKGQVLGANLFAYCGNNPVNAVDSTGWFGTPIQLACAVIGGVAGWFFGDYVARGLGFAPSRKGWWNASKYWAVRAGVVVGGAAVGWFAGTAVIKLAQQFLITQPILLTFHLQ